MATPKQFGPYFMAGWRVWSELELPELHPLDDAGEYGPSLRIEVGEHPKSIGRASFDVNDHGDAELRIPEVALFSMPQNGASVRIHAEPGADPVLIRAYLFGTALAALCYRRNLLPVHASAVLIDGKAVMFSGPSGAGKSTLATALVQRGHALLSDDVCPIDFSSDIPHLWPAIARVKLMLDAAARFELNAATTYTRGLHGLKGCFSMSTLAAQERVTRQVPVAAACFLDLRGGDHVSIDRLNAREAFVCLEGQVHRGAIGRKLGASEAMFRETCQMAGLVPMYRVGRPDSLQRLGETADRIEHICAGL